MSTPFQGQPGAQQTFDALRSRREESSDANRTDARLTAMAHALGDHEDRLRALESRPRGKRGRE